MDELINSGDLREYLMSVTEDDLVKEIQYEEYMQRKGGTGTNASNAVERLIENIWNDYPPKCWRCTEEIKWGDHYSSTTLCSYCNHMMSKERD